MGWREGENGAGERTPLRKLVVRKGGGGGTTHWG